MARTSSLISRVIAPTAARIAQADARMKEIEVALDRLAAKMAADYEASEDEKWWLGGSAIAEQKGGRFQPHHWDTQKINKWRELPDGTAPEPAATMFWRMVEEEEARRVREHQRNERRRIALENEWAAIA